MIRFLTSGESHGKSLVTIVEGFPANLRISKSYIDAHLKRRQMGYGRGGRMKIETDEVEILSGVRFNKTLGSPVCLKIDNHDWENWTDRMPAEGKANSVEKITIPRPGHADMVGITKYNFDDIRNSIERSSARETAARVAACSIARKFLELFGIYVGSFVENIGNIYSKNKFQERIFYNEFEGFKNAWEISLLADKSEVRTLDKEQETKIIRKIKTAKKRGDTLGGSFIVIATGVPPGLGSFTHYDTKLNAGLAHAIMSINAVKGVEIGKGFESSEKFGSEVHDRIVLKGQEFSRKTNFAGGIEGGVSNGMPIIIRGAMKPIATLMSPIETVDLKNFKSVKARRERSDFVAVPACAVIAESMTAWELAKYFLVKFGGDSVEETMDNYKAYKKKLYGRIKKNFKT